MSSMLILYTANIVLHDLLESKLLLYNELVQTFFILTGSLTSESL
jgi:hypothetical protein